MQCSYSLFNIAFTYLRLCFIPLSHVPLIKAFQLDEPTKSFKPRSYHVQVKLSVLNLFYRAVYYIESILEIFVNVLVFAHGPYLIGRKG